MLVVNPSLEAELYDLSSFAEFQGLCATQLKLISLQCRWRRYEADEVVVRYHDSASDVYWVVSGQVRITYHSFSGQEVLLSDFSAGEMFGELSAIDGCKRSATVMAKTNCLLASMPNADFLQLVYTHSSLCLAILQRLTRQVRRLTERVFDFSTLAVRQRLHTELLHLAQNHLQPGSNRVVISPAPTHHDMANLISTHREAITRELNILAKEKILTRDKRDLIILDLNKLKKLVYEARGSY